MDGKLNLYQETITLGNSQIDLIVQVYDGAIAAFQNAKESYKKDNNADGHKYLEKAKQFVTHLYTTLDMNGGGQISDQLGKLYAFIINKTNVIEATKDLSQIDDNLVILKNLRLGWVGLKEQKMKNEKFESSPEVNINKQFTTSA